MVALKKSKKNHEQKEILLIGFGDLDDASRRLVEAFEGKKQEPRHTFVSLDLMWKTLTPRRQELLQAMAGKEPMSIRGLHKLMERDLKAIHGDVQALLFAGLLEKVGDKIVFPYDGFHVDYELKAVA
ncbi:hypothetical protein AmDm5_1365 [Acetobacter malorum]|uniref:HVO_A0114 family putative DNA-binding protein n=1 Tax=Acetobacter persici TaxID=1076596 RepID=UPI00050508C5|nr:transcriptional regulator [Acetobacter persici]KFL89918.1 hypothetical protein AmDm5_1365 [Acetobacter malorum]MCG0998887.1 transcriptional regulator [Acetobacter persici]